MTDSTPPAESRSTEMLELPLFATKVRSWPGYQANATGACPTFRVFLTVFVAQSITLTLSAPPLAT